ncbi:TPA: hypothetical protein ACX6Q7_001883 [Photobacterium damselae]
MNDVKKDLFVEKIIKNKIKPPTRHDFKLANWNQEWGKVEADASERDKKVYKAGVIIDSVLSEVRAKLKELYKNAPKTSYERLMLSYVAIANRTTDVALKVLKEAPAKNAQEALLEANMMGNKQSLGEIAHGAVDGVQLAIRSCLYNLEQGNKIELSQEPIDEMSFVQQESWLSQLYWTYTHLWQCIIWSDYDLIEMDEEQKFFSVKQPTSAYELAFLNSANRKERLSGQNTLMATRPAIRAKFLDDKFPIITRQNKKRVAKVISIRDGGDDLITWNTQWRIREFDLQSHYPEKWLTDDYGKGFCLSEALEVMRCLMLMSNDSKRKFPVNDSVFNINKLNEFCPTVQVFSLKRVLTEATGVEAQKVEKIVDFLTIKASPTSDLWCQPFIKNSKNEYALVVSALSSPSVFRLFERWADEFGVDLGEKGYTYEETIIEELNDALENNDLIQDYDKGISKRIKLAAGKEEEFDLLARIDDLIIVGEAKSIVTTDSEISKYRTSEILQHAGEQVIRKTAFFQDNVQAIFERLDWAYDETKEYKFAQCVLNSSSIFVGHKFSDVPVIDDRILRAYFSSNQMKLMTVASKTGIKTIAWYKLYDSLEELKDNLSTYLSNPPQLNDSKDAYEYNDIRFPYMTADSYKLSKSYLVQKESSPLSVMDREHHFPVIKSDDYEAEAAQVKVAM